MSFNQGKLDGFPVELYDGRFSGAFELEDEEGEAIGYDDTVTFLVVASADKVAFSTLKNGELKRTNTFKILSSRIVPVATAAEWVHALNEGIESEPKLFETPEWDDKDFYGEDAYEDIVLDLVPNTLPSNPEFMDDDLVIVKPQVQISASDPALAAFLNEG